MIRNLLRITVIVIATSKNIFAIDNPHFYRSTFFWGEPRFEKNALTSFELKWAGASTSHGYNSSGKKTPLGDIYGFSALQNLAENIPTLSRSNTTDALLLDLMQLPHNATFAELSFGGSFQILEAVFNAYQNIVNGFFIQTYLPIRHIKTSSISYTDMSPESGFPNKNNSTWQRVLSDLPNILGQYHIDIKQHRVAGMGDLSLLIGWACNYEKTINIDFIDVDSRIGLLFPTGKRRNEDAVFSLPLGYNGHFAVPLKFNCSFGAWEWFTAGVHLGAIFFFDKHVKKRIKTSENQRGIISLVEEKASVDQGTIWDVDCYIKADHVLRGFSLLCGYSFNKKDRDSLSLLQQPSPYNESIINSDERLKGWAMHTIHLMAEYDFALYNSDYLPRIGFFYDLIVGGRRIFNASMKSLYFGIDLAWCY